MGSDRSDAALRDLEAIEAQRAAGLLDDGTAERLWARYAREALATQDATGTRDAPEGSGSLVDDKPTGRGPWARPLGILVLVAGAAAATTVGLDVTDRGAGEFVTGNEATASSRGATGQGRDLSQVTNEELEEVVAANPDVVAMRLRLAHRYLDDGELDRAVQHYLQVLEREDDPEAMSHLGWILFTQGRVDLAAPLLEASRRLDPQEPEAIWFQANLLLYGQDDAGAAIPLLEDLLRRDDLGETQRADVEATLREARGRRGATP